MADATWVQENDSISGTESWEVSIDTTDNNTEVLELNPLLATTVCLDVVSGDTITIQVCNDIGRENLISLTDAAGSAFSTTSDDTIVISQGFSGIKVLGGSQAGATVVNVRQA